jgi:hypothetical protein
MSKANEKYHITNKIAPETEGEDQENSKADTHNEYQVNARGLKYPDDGPLPTVLPEKNDSEVLHYGTLKRKFIDTKGVKYVQQNLVLTKERLLIARNGDDAVFDDVLLRDVIECELKEDEKNPDALEVIFRTSEDGYNSGRSYIFMSQRKNSEDWEAAVDDAVANAKAKHREDFMQFTFGHNRVALFRARCKIVHDSKWFQYAFAIFILLGFLQDLLESSIVPPVLEKHLNVSDSARRFHYQLLAKGGGPTSVGAATGEIGGRDEEHKQILKGFKYMELTLCILYTLVSLPSFPLLGIFSIFRCVFPHLRLVCAQEFSLNTFSHSANCVGDAGFLRNPMTYFDGGIVLISIISVIIRWAKCPLRALFVMILRCLDRCSVCKNLCFCVLCVAYVRVRLMVMMYYITPALYWILSPSLLTPREHLAELQNYCVLPDSTKHTHTNTHTHTPRSQFFWRGEDPPHQTVSYATRDQSCTGLPGLRVSVFAPVS